MGLIDAIRDKLLTWLMPDEYMDIGIRERLEKWSLWKEYYAGNYRRQLRVKPLQADDNIGLNFTGLIVDRSISMLLGDGIEFELDEPAEGQASTPAQDYVDSVYAANKSGILLHKAAQYAAIYGTGFLKILPDGVEYKGEFYPRLVALDPMWMRIDTVPEDIETVNAYEIRYNVEKDNRKVAVLERTERMTSPDGDTVNWVIRTFESDRNGHWEQVGADVVWDYEFPPIIHWQNLPQPSDVWGQSDIEDVVDVQDRINFIASNISKIIRYHAHPKTWGVGMSASSKTSWGADEMVLIQGENGKIANLEMQTDLASSRAYLMELRQTLFDISRTVDITSMADKLGTLTNFGLHVLFMDSMNKLGTKQELMGEMLSELNHRLLTIKGVVHEDGGYVVWGDPLPEDQVAETTAIETDLSLGLVSKKTASLARGYDYDQEVLRMEEEKSKEESIGSILLNAFDKGQ